MPSNGNVSAKLDKTTLQKVVRKCALRMYNDLGTPVSQACADLLKNGRYAELVQQELDPTTYNTAWEFQKDYQAIALLKKSVVFPTGIDTAKVAFEKFMEAEASCLLTNTTLQETLRGKRHVQHILFCAARKIEGWLGSVKVSVNDMRYGPGASSSCSGGSISIPGKLQSTLDCSFRARWLVPLLLSIPGFAKANLGRIDGIGNSYSDLTGRQVQIVNSNRLVFVPKNAKTDRAICIEPHVNIMGQLMVGKALRRALRYANLDLDRYAVKTNIRLAKQGSIDGSYATIDLAAASDSISCALVEQLLPDKWLDLLYSLRSEWTTLPDGSTHENAKFSSMGNGFTFELESMIFYAIALAVKDNLGLTGTVSVFGDDIVCPTEMSDVLIDVLETVGFRINSEKTFVTGPFRESCGFDFFSGVNVRPYFLKGEFVYMTDLFKILNGIRSASSRMCLLMGPDGPYCDATLRRSWNCVLQFIPKDIRFYGPRSFGDAVIWCPRNEATAAVGMQYGIMKLQFVDVITKKRSLTTFPLSVAISALLLGSPSDVTIRGTKVPKVRKTAISAWSWDEGNWLG